MKRYIFFIIMALSASLGCRQQSPELVFAIGGAPNELDYWETLIGEFEARSGYPVTILRHPTDTDQRRQSLVISLKARKNDPDVFLMDVAWVSQFAASDWLHPLDAYVNKDDPDFGVFFAPVVNQVDIYNDTLFALPVYVDCGLLYYRRDLLDTYDFPVPVYWKDLVAAARKIQEAERKTNPQFYGFVWQGAQYEGLVCTFLEFIAAAGGSLLNDNDEISLVHPANIQALIFMRDLLHEYKISPPNTYTEMREEEVRAYFQNGNALFERNWPYAWKLHQEEGSEVKGKIGITVLPAFENGDHAAALGGWHIGISKFSDNVEQAWELAAFIVSYDTQKKLAINLGWNPGRSDIYDDEEVKTALPHIPALKKALEYAVARPPVPIYTRISGIIQKYVNTALAGNLEPEEALKNAQSEIDRIVRTYNE